MVFKRCLIFILSHECVWLPKLIATGRKTNGSAWRWRAEWAKHKLTCELFSNADIMAWITPAIGPASTSFYTIKHFNSTFHLMKEEALTGQGVFSSWEGPGCQHLEASGLIIMIAGSLWKGQALVKPEEASLLEGGKMTPRGLPLLLNLSFVLDTSWTHSYSLLLWFSMGKKPRMGLLGSLMGFVINTVAWEAGNLRACLNQWAGSWGRIVSSAASFICEYPVTTGEPRSSVMTLWSQFYVCMCVCEPAHVSYLR